MGFIKFEEITEIFISIKVFFKKKSGILCTNGSMKKKGIKKA